MIAEMIRRMVQDLCKPEIMLAKVKDFDEQKWLATVEISIGATIEQVRIKAVINDESTGLFIEPAVGSYVLVGMIDGKLESCSILQFSEIVQVQVKAPKIQLKGDQYKGMVILEKCEQNFDKISQYLSALNTAISSALTAVGASTAASGSAGAASFNTSMASQQLQYLNMENKDVQHG